MDYKKEYATLKDYQTKDWFKPEKGTYQVKCLSEPVPANFVDPVTGNKVDQIELLIEVDGQKKYWTVTKGLTLVSLYGQLVSLGARQGGLEGERFTVHVKFAGIGKGGRPKHDYFIPEAVPDHKVVGGSKEGSRVA